MTNAKRYTAFCHVWLSIGSAAIVDANAKISADGHHATMRAASTKDLAAALGAGFTSAALARDQRLARIFEHLGRTGKLHVQAVLDEVPDHLRHYAGAAHRDPVAYQMCLAYLRDPDASEPELKSRALKAAHGWDVSPEQISAVGAASQR